MGRTKGGIVVKQEFAIKCDFCDREYVGMEETYIIRMMNNHMKYTHKEEEVNNIEYSKTSQQKYNCITRKPM